MDERYPYARIGAPAKLLSAFLPEYREARATYVNLDREARDRITNADATQLSEASYCATFVNELHERLSVDASFGGYLEDRAFLWQGTYLGGSAKTIHLGVDFNVPSGAVVTTPFSGTVIRIDNDHPERWGWGPRVCIESSPTASNALETRSIFIFAHLAEVSARVGDTLECGAEIGIVGEPPFNGDWFPHLHVQQARGDLFDAYLKNDIWSLDGYGDRDRLATLSRDFPDPIDSLARRRE